jgi:putative ATP-dependent endonuclease of OLD family
MHLEQIRVSNFRCFGPTPETITFDPGVTAFVGTNGAGKTAVMQALLRLFGVAHEQRRLRRQDFHIPLDEETPPKERSLFIEAILAFPELDTGDAVASSTIPEFFKHMATDDNGHLKCRLYLKATWNDDGSLEGSIDWKLWAVRTLAPVFNEENECQEVRALDRSRVQLIYVPAVRDGISQVSAFLKGRLWKAITWSDELKAMLGDAGEALNNKFRAEPGVASISTTLQKRWQEIHSAGTDTDPLFRPIDLQLEGFIKKVDVVFRPDEAGKDRDMDDLSDGQRSLFHIAMAAATLDIEDNIVLGAAGTGFQTDGIVLPALTLIAIEEPENNLAPFYLSRIIRQIEDVTKSPRGQALIASHSASILARIEPSNVRHFQLDTGSRTAHIRNIPLPGDADEAAKFVREAVRTYPEMYFARFVVLGEGSSEEVVIPRLAEAMGMHIDRSFVAVVPLGGRHVNHLWRLLSALRIPHATLLDLDLGRAGGGWGRVRSKDRRTGRFW